MKIENNNKEIIQRITKRSLKTNKVRNIFAILAIILTTFMISSVFSVGISFVKNYKTMNTRLQGTTADTYLQRPTSEQINKIKDLNIFNSTGSEINVGKVHLDNLRENRTSVILKYHDKDNFKNQISPALGDIKGSYPESNNEIMISRLALELLNKNNSKIGDKIDIPCKINDEVKNESFTIKGIFTSYGLTQDVGYIFVSEKFVSENNLTIEKNGLFSMKTKKDYMNASSDILSKEVKLNKNQKFDYSYAVDDLTEQAISIAIIVLVIVSFIILSGYLLIYNVFYIAVTKDINFYGLLKTIGSSPKQIKKIVKGQALRLSIIGIPIGLAVGAIVSFGIVPAVMAMFFSGTSQMAMPGDVSFSPLIFILSALFSLITVIISCRKPAKIAGNISPVEALRYTGAKAKKQKKNRNTTNGGKIYKMAWYNVFRDKKRAILVFLSLFMGIIAFLSVNTFIDSIKVENYINEYVPNDFELQNENATEGKMDNDVLDNIKNMTGVEEVTDFKISTLRLTMNNDIIVPSLKSSFERFGQEEENVDLFIENSKENPEFLDTNVIGIDDKTIAKINKNNNDKFDVEAFQNGDLILISNWYYGDKYKDIKGNLTINNTKEKISQTFNTQVIKFDESLPDGLPTPLGIPTIYMSQLALEGLDKKSSNYVLYVNVDDKYEEQIKASLEKISKSQGLMLESKTGMTELFNKTSMVQRILGGGISIILILIGILNFVNVMITGVNIRLKELAVMESIGMTKKQIKKMLTFEGVYYAGITMALIYTIGIGIIFGVSVLTKNVADYAVFTFPTVQLVTLTIVIFIICLVTPVMVFKSSSKESVTERIREIEK
ncbi:FtsX-like permease family protein [Clostridium ihumii]|uniref:ABC transporter permease n=1 Tax=Clostridium ihumii TaxID=1470356 RepID=UPI003D34DE65